MQLLGTLHSYLRLLDLVSPVVLELKKEMIVLCYVIACFLYLFFVVFLNTKAILGLVLSVPLKIPVNEIVKSTDHY